MIAVAITSGYGGKAQRKKEGETDRERERALHVVDFHTPNKL